MRYLRPFNESIDIDELQSFCDNALAYLKDDGFVIVVKKVTIDNDVKNRYNKIKDSKTGRSKFIKIIIGKYDYHRIGGLCRGTMFEWDDVKDDLIPFLEIINNKYDNIYDVVFMSPNYDINSTTSSNITSSNTISCNIIDVINEDLSTSYITNGTDLLLGIEINIGILF